MADGDAWRGSVHLVGSVPLASPEEVMRTASALLGPRLLRVPDGETGVRANWIRWQSAVFQRHASFEVVAPADAAAYSPGAIVRLRRAAADAPLSFGRLGYAEMALASYATLVRLRRAGRVSRDLGFQVSLPTPLAPVTWFVAPEDQARVEPAYEAALLAEVDEITRAIPHQDLSIQWDVAVEFALLEGLRAAHFHPLEAGICARLVRLANHVPQSVELGFHLCYGDAEHAHFTEPQDTAKLVRVANAISSSVARPIHWIHLPVPRARADEAYVAPLRDLSLGPATRLHLGLVHLSDGAAGAERRIRAARRFVGDFGVGTECGLGRRSPATIPGLLALHAEIADRLYA